MTITSQQYAYLADHSYGRDEHGNPVDLKALVGKVAVIGGVQYEVLAYADKPSGYQGAIYQRVDTGEIVVAHRGTEFDRQKWADLAKADGLMTFSRFNPQADDAIALTKLAIVEAKKYADATGVKPPPVTHTGHSLGGTLAQISGHYFGQKGETFNAYGAASLNIHNPATGDFYHLPKGGNAFVNHVMGADLVSAASPQYGQERRYTNRREIETLERYGYENNRGFDVRFEGAAVAAMSGGSHDMHNFLPWNGDNKRDTSILAEPAAQRMATQYDPMLDKYRVDVEMLRKTVGAIGTNMQDIIQVFKDPLEAGEPARRAERQQRGQQGASLSPESIPDMRTPGHPANEKYLQAYAGMSEIDRTMGRTPDQITERVAASLTAHSARFESIDRVVLSTDGNRAFAMEGGQGPVEARGRVAVDVNEAIQRPVEASTKDWLLASQQLTQDQARQQALMQEKSQNGPALA